MLFQDVANSHAHERFLHCHQIRAMAVALLATLYGALVANLIAMPIASRLKRLARTEAAERQRLIAPLAALAKLERARKRELAA